jgi:hypothetical protein
MQMGILTVQEYLQYYLQDAIGESNFYLGSASLFPLCARFTASLHL